VAVGVGMTVGVGSLLTMAGGGRVTVGAAVGGNVAGTAVSAAAISVGEVDSEALTGFGEFSPPQATRIVTKMNKVIS